MERLHGEAEAQSPLERLLAVGAALLTVRAAGGQQGQRHRAQWDEGLAQQEEQDFLGHREQPCTLSRRQLGKPGEGWRLGVTQGHGPLLLWLDLQEDRRT